MVGAGRSSSRWCIHLRRWILGGPSMTPRLPVQLSSLAQFWATFNPKRTDDLKPGVAEQIGRRFRWEASWVIEDEYAYAGDWHCTLLPDQLPVSVFLWSPLCDLDDVELIDD